MPKEFMKAGIERLCFFVFFLAVGYTLFFDTADPTVPAIIYREFPDLAPYYSAVVKASPSFQENMDCIFHHLGRVKYADLSYYRVCTFYDDAEYQQNIIWVLMGEPTFLEISPEEKAKVIYALFNLPTKCMCPLFDK